MPVGSLGGEPANSTSIATNAALLEGLGYESIWVFDAVGRGFILPDPLMALAVAATATETIELGTGVLQLPIRNVPELAHRIFSLHLLAGDRLALGVGPGSTEADFLTFGADFERRFADFDAQYIELKQWLADGGVGQRTLSPWSSVAGGPDLYLAGWRGRWVERAATESAGWIASAANADDATLADAIVRFRDTGGKRAVVTNVQVSEEIGPVVDRLHHLAELGFDDAIVFDLKATEDRLAGLLAQWKN